MFVILSGFLVLKSILDINLNKVLGIFYLASNSAHKRPFIVCLFRSPNFYAAEW